MAAPRNAGFSLLEVTISMSLVGVALTGVLGALVASEKVGASGRDYAEASALARSIAGDLALAPYGDPRFADNNTANNATYADPAAAFAAATLPTGAAAPDSVLGTFSVGSDNFTAVVNVAPDVDGLGVEQGRQFAVVVRYQVGSSWGRVVVLGYRYNPATNGAGVVPL